MSLRASASSFVPGQSFRMDPNIPSFVPQRNSSGRNSAARNIQRRVRGNRVRSMQRNIRGDRPIDYDVQRKIMNRYILDDELDDFEEKKDILETNIERNKLKRENRLADELKRIPSRENRMNRGQEEQRLRHRRARTKRAIRAMRNLPEDQREDNIPFIEDIGLEDYNYALESGSSDEELNSEDEEDMKLKENRRRDLEYYREQDKLDMDEEGPILNDEYILEEIDEKLEEMKRMDVIRCKRVREMIEADPMLYKDKRFYEMYLKPCKDETTRVYIDTFFNIDWRWIKPVGKRPVYPRTGYGEGLLRYGTDEYRKAMADFNKQVKTLEIEDVINKISGKFFPRSCKTALIDCLIELELLTTTNREYGSGPPFLKFDVLSNFFRWNKGPYGNRLSLRHLPYGSTGTAAAPVRNFSIVSRGLSGREELERLFDLFRETVTSRNLKHYVIIDGRKQSVLIDDDKIEQMIRYFILRLIGIVGNPTYIEQLTLLRDNMVTKLNSLDQSQGMTREDVTLKEDIEKLKAWIEGVEGYF
jgi:hypothetical protein